jgi:hypothetical protein
VRGSLDQWWRLSAGEQLLWLSHAGGPKPEVRALLVLGVVPIGRVREGGSLEALLWGSG